jgi:hypothetical protein
MLKREHGSKFFCLSLVRKWAPRKLFTLYLKDFSHLTSRPRSSAQFVYIGVATPRSVYAVGRFFPCNAPYIIYSVESCSWSVFRIRIWILTYLNLSELDLFLFEQIRISSINKPSSINKFLPVVRIHDILVLIRIRGSMPLN